MRRVSLVGKQRDRATYLLWSSSYWNWNCCWSCHSDSRTTNCLREICQKARSASSFPYMLRWPLFNINNIATATDHWITWCWPPSCLFGFIHIALSLYSRPPGDIGKWCICNLSMHSWRCTTKKKALFETLLPTHNRASMFKINLVDCMHTNDSAGN